MPLEPPPPTADLEAAKSILFLSPDGMMEPLGASQVLAYVFGLSRLGYKYEILSLEKEKDRRIPGAEAAVRAHLAAEGIGWTVLPYEGAGLLLLCRTYRRALVELQRKWRSGKFGLLHSRSYVMGLLARHVAKNRYIYDARGYWVDERKEAGRWFRLPLMYGLGKSFEFKVAQDAAAIVTLTDLQGDDFRARFPGKPIVRIGTCVDFNRFRPDAEVDQVPEAIRSRLTGKLVLGLIGSINNSYRISESIRLFRHVHSLEPRAYLLCLTRQVPEMRENLLRAGMAENDFSIASVPHDQIHEWMSLVHWGLLILQESFAKRASMPTKLGEMFACGVRPVQYGCNEEVTRLVREAGSGIILKSLSDEDLRAAAPEIIRIGRTRDGISEARTRMQGHFSLEIGTMKYAELLAVILDRRQAQNGGIQET